MRRFLALPAVLVVLAAAGCGGADETAGEEHAEPTGPIAVDSCLGQLGYGLLPATSGISAVTPSGKEFAIAFFDTPEAASSAADSAGGRATAVDTAVVTASGKALTRAELDEIRECVQAGAG